MRLDLSKEKCPACDGTDLKVLNKPEQKAPRSPGSVVLMCGDCSLEYAVFVPGKLTTDQ
jgi:hypothetical protein